MKKIYTKLVATTLMFLLAVTVTISASYAWFVMSKSPIVDGIQVSISGSDTILIAADLTQVVNGVTYHYPDAFSDKLSFAGHSNYSYLKDLAGLRPVSTADGINWFIADKYDADDWKVQNGEAIVGQVCDVEDMIRDISLKYANLTDTEENQSKLDKGHYVALDFWVVSPGADYYLRVSANDDGGSFVIDLLEPVTAEADSNTTGYTLNCAMSSTAATVRVGFLATQEQLVDDTMVHYQQSTAYDKRFTALRGVYAETGSGLTYADYRFTIYEPNADAHPGDMAEDGSYVQTFPIGLVNGVPQQVSVQHRLTLQKTTRWKPTEQGTLLIEQIFQTALIGQHISGTDPMEFYRDYLQYHFAPYVESGDFIKETAQVNSSTTAEQFGILETAGATEDSYIIQLQKNVPQRIRMYVWLEGQDADWDPKNAASSFVLNLELAGGTE